MDVAVYSEWQAEDSLHSINRAKERAGLNRKKALKMMEHAKVRGITSEDCTWSIDRSFLECKSNKDAIAVAYNGYCFILDRGTMNCITMFHLPKCFGQKKTFYKNTLKKSSRWEEAYYRYE